MKLFKKIGAIFLAGMMVMSFAGCDNGSDDPEDIAIHVMLLVNGSYPAYDAEYAKVGSKVYNLFMLKSTDSEAATVNGVKVNTITCEETPAVELKTNQTFYYKETESNKYAIKDSYTEGYTAFTSTSWAVTTESVEGPSSTTTSVCFPLGGKYYNTDLDREDNYCTQGAQRMAEFYYEDDLYYSPSNATLSGSGQTAKAFGKMVIDNETYYLLKSAGSM